MLTAARIAFVAPILCSCCLAQNLNLGGGGGFGQGGFGQGGQGGTGQGQQFGGITINPDGIVRSAQAQQINLRLEQQRLKAVAGQKLPSNMTKPSELRMVSLARLERELQRAIDEEKPVSEELRYLAGITQLQYLFVLPDENDIVIAGAAEGFAPMENGVVVGIETGRPVLMLDDLLVMLRIQNLNQQIGCSFDPEPERLAKAQTWNRANNSPTTVNVARQRFHRMAEVLGNWNVTVFNLPGSSHAAVAMVEADYHLKQLGLGLERPGVRGFRSYLEMAGANQNSMRRWWLAPRYEVIERTPDGLTFHISGPRLQLISQEELVDEKGNRSDAPFTEVSTERYTKQFNRHMEELCQRVNGFAAVRNLFDLAVFAALIREHDLHRTAGWRPTLLLDADAVRIEEFHVPTEVPSMVNVKASGSRLLIGQIGGGVVITPSQIISDTKVLAAEDVPAFKATESAWWWD